MKKLALALLIPALLVTLAPAPADAGVPKHERKQIRQKLADTTLYLKVDAPCVTGRHPFGVYYSPLVQASPSGVNTEDQQGMGFGWYHVDSAYWGIQVNDPVELDDLEFDGSSLEVEMEGVREAEGDKTVIEFVDINSYTDFERAFDHVLSTRPLQYLHDDWSEEIKSAIADRRLMEGMTQRQVYYITGAPESFERHDQDGVEIEVWRLRQNKGMRMGFFRSKGAGATGLPDTLRFEDGALVNVVGKGTGSGFSLD